MSPSEACRQALRALEVWRDDLADGDVAKAKLINAIISDLREAVDDLPTGNPDRVYEYHKDEAV